MKWLKFVLYFLVVQLIKNFLTEYIRTFLLLLAPPPPPPEHENNEALQIST
jgi:hypothetical protein